MRRLIGDSSVGPVRDLLALAPGEQRRVVDLGTGTGQWCVLRSVNRDALLTPSYRRVLDMAREFPHVRIYGVKVTCSGRLVGSKEQQG